jgi:hypothetical protein
MWCPALYLTTAPMKIISRPIFITIGAPNTHGALPHDLRIGFPSTRASASARRPCGPVKWMKPRARIEYVGTRRGTRMPDSTNSSVVSWRDSNTGPPYGPSPTRLARVIWNILHHGLPYIEFGRTGHSKIPKTSSRNSLRNSVSSAIRSAFTATRRRSVQQHPNRYAASHRPHPRTHGRGFNGAVHGTGS